MADARALDGVRILAVHHDAGRNGATLLFQTVLEGLVADHGAVVTSYFPYGGPMVERAAALGPVHVDEVEAVRRGGVRGRLARPPRRPPRPRPSAFDLVFANSAASYASVRDVLGDDTHTPLAVYVHESGYLLQHVVDFSLAKWLLRRADLLLAVSPRVRATLEELVEPTAPIEVVAGFVPVQRPFRTETAPDAPAEATPPSPPVVGAIGTMSWYKGTDLFLVVARRIRELLPDADVRFVWVGGGWRIDTLPQVQHDIALAGLGSVVELTGEVDDPERYLRSFTLMLLPSREDSWPLVMLEAAVAGVPLICFEGAGGAEHYVAGGGGVAVPYLDVEAMAHAAVRYITDAGLRTRDSLAARERAGSPSPGEQIDAVATVLARTIVAPRS